MLLQAVGKHVVIGCTVLPGYIANVGRFLISDCKDCSLRSSRAAVAQSISIFCADVCCLIVMMCRSYNPEFIAQGEIVKGQLAPDVRLSLCSYCDCVLSC